MTIITAVQKDNEIAIACDTQSSSSNSFLKCTADYKINDTKLIPYGHNILGLSGSIAISQIFEDLLSKAEPAPLASRSNARVERKKHRYGRTLPLKQPALS